MKLFSAETGLTADASGVNWTTDGGHNWTEITPLPPGVRRAAIAIDGLFFRDKSEGWAIVSYKEQATPVPPHTRIDAKTIYIIAHTTDSGVNWSFTPLTYPELPEWIQDSFAGPADLYFVDSLHGWLDVGFEGNSKPGKLLATEDGGKTWKWVNSPPVSGPITFVSSQDGWLVSNWGADTLYVTHDGCKSWQEMNLSPPAQVGAAVYPTFQAPPVFQDDRRGFLVVHYSGGPNVPTKLVVYSTTDKGRSWQPVKVLSEAHEATRAAGFPFAIVDSNIIISTGLSNTTVSIAAVRLDGHSSDASASYHGVLALTFADERNGWVLSAGSGLLATHDGGSSWEHIGRAHAPSSPTFTVPALKGPVSPNGLSSSGVQPLASTIGSNTHISKHLGFDKSYVRPVSDMATWWKYSPYYDTYLYLPGSRLKTDPNLNSAWVTQVKSQGWGLIPIWFGRQAPCAKATFSSYIDPVTAAAQGKSDADSAANAASSLGLAKTVIYKDMEDYDTTDMQCDSAVTTYIGAWVSELHASYYSAGVYANPLQAERNIWDASPVPDEIWVAKWDSKATIWGLGDLEDTPWTSNQRSHQYINYNNNSPQPQGETYGGLTLVCPMDCIDRDIDDAPAAGKNGLKTYSSWAVTLVDYPDSPPNTSVYAINGGYMHQLDSNGNPMSPILTGTYCVQCNSNSTDVGFYWNNGSFTSVNESVNGRSEPFGVNNFNQIVGYYYPYFGVAGNLQAFLFDTSTGVVSVLNAPGAALTAAFGINDASQIVGSWTDGSGNEHGFIYDKPNWAPVDHSGTKSTVFKGINGIGQVASYYGDAKGNDHAFVYSKADGWIDINCSGQSSTAISGINNNGQVVGSCGTSAFIYDVANGFMAQISGLPAYSDAMGVSDSNVAVGLCHGAPCTAGGLQDGFYATPNP